MLNIRRQRTEAGKPTVFLYNGIKVEDKKLRRQVKENVRREVARRPAAVDRREELRLLSGSAFHVSNSMYVTNFDPIRTLVQSNNP